MNECVIQVILKTTTPDYNRIILKVMICKNKMYNNYMHLIVCKKKNNLTKALRSRLRKLEKIVA